MVGDVSDRTRRQNRVFPRGLQALGGRPPGSLPRRAPGITKPWNRIPEEQWACKVLSCGI